MPWMRRKGVGDGVKLLGDGSVNRADVNCLECDKGKLLTEWRDTFPRQWVFCSSCNFEVPSFCVVGKVLDAFKNAGEKEVKV